MRRPNVDPVSTRPTELLRAAPSSSRTVAVEPQGRGAVRATHEPPARRRWSSLQLLGDQHEIEIAHADSIYRLRITALGKLILTK
jgi:hemin uptake protein HemP